MINRLGRIILSLVMALMIQSLLSTHVTVSAAGLVRPSGMIVRDEDGKYYYVYYLPGTNYSDPRLKYIGQAEVLDYYMSRGRRAYNITNAEKAGYTVHNHVLNVPCGEAVRDNEGRIAFLEPLGWPPGAQDQADSIFSFAENFAYYVPYVNWDYPARTNSHHQNILKEYGYNQLPAISSLIEPSIYPFGIPNCAIVKQTGTNDYYRVFRHQQPDATEIERKMKIPTPEMLNLWKNFNSYAYIDVDITSLPNVSNVKMPPGLLVRTVDTSNVYFTDDEGNKVLIPTLDKFVELGFALSDVTYVQQSTLDASSTKNLY